jgi:rubrerythrin
MEKYSVHEIIEQAVQTERLGYAFYTGMLKKFEKDAKLQELFSMLAAKEQQHEKRFSQLKDKIAGRVIDDAEEVSSFLRAIVESEFFLGKNKSLPSLEHIRSAADAARFALGFEKETLLYFYSLKEIVKEKEPVNEIIEEEKGHVRWLNEYIKSL